jgi:hypothetical protein
MAMLNNQMVRVLPRKIGDKPVTFEDPVRNVRKNDARMARMAVEDMPTNM